VKYAATFTRMWAKVGEQPIVLTPPGRENVYLDGVVDPETGEVFIEEAESTKAPGFQAYLEHVLARFGEEGTKLWVFLDNARVHHAKDLKTFLTEVDDRLELQFLPAYSPEFNPQERVWRCLRGEETHDTYYPTTGEWRSHIFSFGARYDQPNETIRTLCANCAVI